MLKVAKFGGSSMADAKQFEKVREIVRADPARRVIVVSAAGKRSADDHKLTDLLYLCYAHLQYGVNCDAVFQMICDRYIAIRDECGLNVDIEAELDVLRRQMRAGISDTPYFFTTHGQKQRFKPICIIIPQFFKKYNENSRQTEKICICTENGASLQNVLLKVSARRRMRMK